MSQKEPRPTKIIETFLADIQLVSHNPRFQTIVTNGVLELLVNTLIEHRCKHGEKITEMTRDYPQSVKLVLLNEKGLITDRQYRLLDAFRDLRNKAAHRAQFNVTPELLRPFKGVFISDKETKLDEPRNFHRLCCDLVFGFWNDNISLFQPLFEPHLLSTEK